MGLCIYDLAMKKCFGKVLQYPLAVLFLLDWHLTWRHNEAELRGDPATNISTGLAWVFGLVGAVLRALRHGK